MTNLSETEPAQAVACPPIDAWRQMLDGAAPPEEEGRLAEHAESCAHCQRQLEQLTAAPQSWARTVRRDDSPDATSPNEGRSSGESSGERTTPVDDETSVAQVVERLKRQRPALESASAHTSPDLPIGFLAPSTRPGSLGRLDEYEIFEEVGRGAMGIVYRALDPKLQRVVAIKVMSPLLATHSLARQRFLREGHSAAAVCHENVVAIHAVGEVHRIPYLVMQFVSGKTVEQKLESSGPLRTAEILRIGMQAAAGLAAAHAQGLVHRDIKPANLLLENGIERVKLTDFGLARAVDDASLTQTGIISGTPQYMAPEQARDEPVDERADLFSLGCVLYALCTGRPPFRGSSTLAVLNRICDSAPRPIRELNAEIPNWLAAIVNKLLAKSPADRFRSANELAQLLERCLQHWNQPRIFALPLEAAALSDAEAAASEAAHGGVSTRLDASTEPDLSGQLDSSRRSSGQSGSSAEPGLSGQLGSSGQGGAQSHSSSPTQAVAPRSESLWKSRRGLLILAAALVGPLLVALLNRWIDVRFGPRLDDDRSRSGAAAAGTLPPEAVADLERIAKLAESHWELAKTRNSRGVTTNQELLASEHSMVEAQLRHARGAGDFERANRLLERRVEIRQKQLEYAKLMRDSGQMSMQELLSAEQALAEAKFELHSR